MEQLNIATELFSKHVESFNDECRASRIEPKVCKLVIQNKGIAMLILSYYNKDKDIEKAIEQSKLLIEEVGETLLIF